MSLVLWWCYLVVAIAMTYLLYLIVIIRYQDKLIFSRPHKNFLLYERLAGYLIKVDTEVGSLQGWRFGGADERSNLAVLLFCGNGDDAANFELFANVLPVKWVYTFNYRGYGGSDGEPSEAALFGDALLMYEKIKTNFPEMQIGVLGFSLGAAIAGYVAVHRHVEFLILLGPVSSLAKIARSRFLFHLLVFLLEIILIFFIFQSEYHLEPCCSTRRMMRLFLRPTPWKCFIQFKPNR